ncbi:unnamed protein product [Darwinula stevensoni]|uniref:Uncharacterized protein n=1 Tax=Darwinula stevensoni TaxID=69355 RepID=A0A7R8XAT4_9CRUS|nr:unnamed protein product [Darwinula stevensoni]CAG0892209.1 unnamed protein product [Darwinula stevensoni]
MLFAGRNRKCRPGRSRVSPFLTLTPEAIQAEIKSWVINKGLDETPLHRAARLGYYDIGLYCLETKLLSYGADPLLGTYSGLTPVALARESRIMQSLLQDHLADVQGKPAPPWQFPSTLGSESETGFDVFYAADLPPDSPDQDDLSSMFFETSEVPMINTYQILEDACPDPFVLLSDLSSRLGQVKSLLARHPDWETREVPHGEFLRRTWCIQLGMRTPVVTGVVTVYTYQILEDACPDPFVLLSDLSSRLGQDPKSLLARHPDWETREVPHGEFLRRTWWIQLGMRTPVVTGVVTVVRYGDSLRKLLGVYVVSV